MSETDSEPADGIDLQQSADGRAVIQDTDNGNAWVAGFTVEIRQ